MATSLPFDPYTYVHPPGVVGAPLTLRNIQYGPHDMQRLNIYRNEIRMPGGNPLWIQFHGGAWTGLDKTSTIEADRQVRLLWAYLLDPRYNLDRRWDVVSVEQRIQGHKLSAAPPLNTPYEQTIEGTFPGTGQISGPWYGWTQIDDVQHAIQWCKDHAEMFGWDPLKVISGGYSAGSMGAMNAAFSPSRHFTIPGMAFSEYDVFNSSLVRGVMNWVGEIDMDPWFMAFPVTQFTFGTLESVALNVRADIERLMLVPDSMGLYPQGRPPSWLGRMLSPVHRITARTPECMSTRIRSHYISGLASETTTVPVVTYSAIPPYDGGGHDWRQLAILQGVCDAAGVDHEGQLIDFTAFPSFQQAWESMLTPCVEWMNETVGL